MNEMIVFFVVDLNKANLKPVKNELVKVVQFLQEDNKAYIYHIDNTSIPENKGGAVGKIANYSHPLDFNLISAIRNTLELQKLEDDNTRKPTFIILDKLTEKTKNSLNYLLSSGEFYFISNKDIADYQVEWKDLNKFIISKLNNKELLPIL